MLPRLNILFNLINYSNAVIFVSLCSIGSRRFFISDFLWWLNDEEARRFLSQSSTYAPCSARLFYGDLVMIAASCSGDCSSMIGKLKSDWDVMSAGSWTDWFSPGGSSWHSGSWYRSWRLRRKISFQCACRWSHCPLLLLSASCFFALALPRGVSFTACYCCHVS